MKFIHILIKRNKMKKHMLKFCSFSWFPTIRTTFSLKNNRSFQQRTAFMNSDWVIRNVMYNSLHYTTVYRLLNAYHVFDFQITSWEHNCIGWRSNRQHECKWTRNGYRNHERKRMYTQVYCLQSEFSKN